MLRPPRQLTLADTARPHTRPSSSSPDSSSSWSSRSLRKGARACSRTDLRSPRPVPIPPSPRAQVPTPFRWLRPARRFDSGKRGCFFVGPPNFPLSTTLVLDRCTPTAGTAPLRPIFEIRQTLFAQNTETALKATRDRTGCCGTKVLIDELGDRMRCREHLAGRSRVSTG